jgi:hemerythrin-like metal-binding protein
VALVEWDPSFSVKVKRCDDDHKKLFELINQMHDAMSEGKGGEVVDKVVKELADYTRYHFAAEEAMLQRTNYPGAKLHQMQHAQFVKQVEKFRQDLKAGQIGQSVQVLRFLKDWLTQHIKETDQRYSEHLLRYGMS